MMEADVYCRLSCAEASRSGLKAQGFEATAEGKD